MRAMGYYGKGRARLKWKPRTKLAHPKFGNAVTVRRMTAADVERFKASMKRHPSWGHLAGRGTGVQ